MGLDKLRGFTYYSYVQKRGALGIRRGSEPPFCEEHHTVVINKGNIFELTPGTKR